MNFHLTQLISGHGAFMYYLHKRKVTASNKCPFCPTKIDTPEHAIFKCRHFDSERTSLEEDISNKLTIEDFQEIPSHPKRTGARRPVSSLPRCRPERRKWMRTHRSMICLLKAFPTIVIFLFKFHFVLTS